MTIELKNSGLVTQTMQEIFNELQESAIQKEGVGFQVSTETPYGKQLAIIAERESLIHEAIQAMYDSFFPDSTTGVSQDRLYLLTDHVRQKSNSSTVVCYVAGDPFTTIESGSLITVNQTEAIFQTSELVTISGDGEINVSSITASGDTATVTTSSNHNLSNDDYVFINDAEQEGYNGLKQIRNVASNTFDYTVDIGIETPATTTSNITAYKGFPVNCESQDKGKIEARAFSLINIGSPVSGWKYASNYLDATLGRFTETDDEFRARRESTLSIQGGAHTEAIKSALLNVSGVTQAEVYENTTGDLDLLTNRPPYSVEAFVVGGEDEEIAKSLYLNVAGGTTQFGNISYDITSSSGETKTMRFSRISTVDVYVNLQITTNSDTTQGLVFPDNGKDLIVDNLVGILFKPGHDLWLPPLERAISSVDGVTSMIVTFGTTSNPTTDTPVSALQTEIIDIDSSRITGTIDGEAI